MTNLWGDRLIARARRLLTDRHFRDTQREFVVESPRDLSVAIEAGLRISSILVSHRATTKPVFQNILQQTGTQQISVLRISATVAKSLSTSPHFSGMLAIVEIPRPCLQSTPPVDGQCWLAISRIRSPGNLGTLLRTAVAANAQGIILIGQSIDPFEPKVIRPAMGAMLRIPVVRSSWPLFKQWATTYECEIVGACPSSNTDLWHTPLAPRTVFMLGEEGAGLSSRQRKACSQLTRIPMNQDQDSLNLGVAGSLLAYEFRRRFDQPELTTQPIN